MSATTIEAPRLYPTRRYRDADAMLRWLVDVVGFRLHAVYRRDDIVEHAELAFGSSILMVGQERDDAYGDLLGEADARRTDSLYVAVDDADALCAKVEASGVDLVMPLRDMAYGSREFSCRDAEGYLWSFGTYWPKAAEPSDA